MNSIFGVIIVVVVGLLFSFLGYVEHKRNYKIEKYRKERELKRKLMLQQKRDEFNAFRNYIEGVGEDCCDCFEKDYKQYIECHENDYQGLLRHRLRYDLENPCPRKVAKRNLSSFNEYYQDDPSHQSLKFVEMDDKYVENIRTELSDLTVGEVLNLYSF